MDSIPAPARHLPLGQQISDPWLRAQLPLAVVARPLDEDVDREVWWQLAQCLEATSHAVACAQDGTAPSSTAILATFALDDTLLARRTLLLDAGPLHPLHPLHAVRDVAPPAGRLVPVESTWFRLAGLLATPAPIPPELLDAVLVDHLAALASWRQLLLAAAHPVAAAG